MQAGGFLPEKLNDHDLAKTNGFKSNSKIEAIAK
jgi:hypothetical protein